LSEVNALLLSQEERIVSLEERNKDLEACEDWFLRWNNGKDAALREDALTDQLRMLRGLSLMGQEDFESLAVNSRWRLERKQREQTEEIKRLKNDVEDERRRCREITELKVRRMR